MLHIGDFICLYCENTTGYVYSDNSSSTNEWLYVHNGQDRDKPERISNVEAVTFQISTQNRYKLTKKYRKLLNQYGPTPEQEDIKTLLQNAKASSLAEQQDNRKEQKRLEGKNLKYGDIIQLRHVLNNRYINVSVTDTSAVDKDKLKVHLSFYGTKNAQFKILPSYKVKVEGEQIENLDQVVFESIKSPGSYLHTSDPYQVSPGIYASEVNLATTQARFTIVQHRTQDPNDPFINRYLWASSVVQLFHRDLEAYLVAEGVFGDVPMEDVHLRVREQNHADTRTLYPPRSGITFWQVESERSLVDGMPIRWKQKVRLRHMTTRLYLSVEEGNVFKLVYSNVSPDTVFRLHSIVQYVDRDEILLGNHARVEHPLTETWLHAERGDTYARLRLTSSEGTSMASLQWDKADLTQISWIKRRPYPDALTIQKVDVTDGLNFNFVAGMIPFIRDIIPQITNTRKVTTKKAMAICTALGELDDFLIVNGKPEKNRQKLLRNLNVLELLIEVLKTPCPEGSNSLHIYRIYRSIYKVLHTFVRGRSRKNALYLARCIPFFLTQLGLEGGVGVHCCKMLIDLIKDNRQIVDRITSEQLDIFVDMLKKHKKSQFLDLLSVLCVCNRTALPDNQLRIATALLGQDQEVLFHIEIKTYESLAVGDELCISTDGRRTWLPLHKFAYKNYSDYSEELFIFLEHQLELYRNLSYRRNEKVLKVMGAGRQLFAWKVLFLGVGSRVLPGSLRANLLGVLTSFYIDYGRECCTVRTTPFNYVYHDIDSRKENYGRLDLIESDIDEKYPGLREWLLTVLDETPFMIAQPVSNSIFIQQVLRLVECLINYGHLSAEEDLQRLLPLITRLADGRHDAPFPPGRGSGITEYTSFEKHHIHQYQTVQRFKKNESQEAIVKAKIQALNVVELLLKRTFNRRLQFVLSVFKHTMEKEMSSHRGTITSRNLLYELMRREFEHRDFNKPMVTGKLDKLLTKIRRRTVYFDSSLPELLYDLTSYESDELVMKSLTVLSNFFSSEAGVFDIITRCQLMTSPEMIALHNLTEAQISTVQALFNSKLNSQQAQEIVETLNDLNSLYDKGDHETTNFVAQNIVVNNGVLDLLFTMILQDVDQSLEHQSSMAQEIIDTSLELLMSVSSQNGLVQNLIFENLEKFLYVRSSGTVWALVLIHVFRGSIGRCLKVQPRHIQQIVRQAGWCKEKAPEIVDFLRNLVKCNSVIIKRNQQLVLRNLMNQFKSAGYVMDLTANQRYDILKGFRGPAHCRYLIALVDLLATCAEGHMRYSESICQSLMTLEELFKILNSSEIPIEHKGPFARYIVWGYLRTGRTATEDGVDQLAHNRDIWRHLRNIRRYMTPSIVNTLKSWQQTEGKRLRYRRDTVFTVLDVEGHSAVRYALQGGFLLVQTFVSKFYEPDPDLFPAEGQILLQLTKLILPFAQACLGFASEVGEVRIIDETVTALLKKQGKTSKLCDDLREQGEVTKKLVQMGEAIKKKGDKDLEEEDLNERFQLYGNNIRSYLNDQKTVASVLGISSRRAKHMNYVKPDEEAKLPLEPVFQQHVKCFVTSHKNLGERYKRALKLIDQLEISSRLYKQTAEPEQEKVDIRSLQILRALIYNQVVQLPDDWTDNSGKHTKTLKVVKSIQDTYCDYNVIRKVMPLLSRENQVLKREVLALMDMMLFNANTNIQRSLLQYFSGTSEEMFFMYVRQRLHSATLALKEKRSMENQRKQRQKWKEMKEAHLKEQAARLQEAKEHEEAAKVQVKVTNRKLKRIQPYLKFLANQRMVRNITNETIEAEYSDNLALIDEEIGVDQSTDNPEEDIGLIFRVIAGLCDGQNRDLQDYLREQPDNVRTVNLVSELCQFLAAHYSAVDAESISLISLIFRTLNEICQGNQPNRTVLVNNKIVDYINFLLRIGHFDGCSAEQVIELRSMIATLLRSLTEENCPEAEILTKELRDTLDLEAIFSIMSASRALYQDQQASAEHLILGYEQPPPSGMFCFQKGESKQIRDSANEVGLTLYLVIARMRDTDQSVEKQGLVDPGVKKGYLFYKHQCYSVEVVKGNHLQRAHFPVRHKDLLREELIMQVKWHIDRSSPSGKLRDLVLWARDIIHDVGYQKKIRGNPITKQLAARWAIWNYACILISLIIQIIMLLTWQSPLVVDQVPSNATHLPIELYSYNPYVAWEDYGVTMEILSICHNCCCVMLVTCYFMLKHPALPRFTFLKALYARCRRRTKGADKAKVQVTHHKSRIAVDLISPETIYYMLLLASSFAGTFVHVYFFAFHLLNIIANVDLLKGVVRAVTLNGKSLLWVAFMGLIIIYIYSIVAFAFFRPIFTPEEELYCGSLYECTVTMLRYGVVGDISENYRLHPLQNDFAHFSYLTIFQVSFFALFTTIGLNIIFGIIVDTFSELRDLKWMAEKDMRGSCFICGIDSHVFENSGQGFLHHVKHEHNMWSYIFYFIYLNEVKDTDYTALDMHVSKMFRADQLDFFPLNRSLGLQNMGDDDNDTKVDDLLNAVKDINRYYRKQEARQRTVAENRQQILWRRQMQRRPADSFVSSDAEDVRRRDDVTSSPSDEDAMPRPLRVQDSYFADDDADLEVMEEESHV